MAPEGMSLSHEASVPVAVIYQGQLGTTWPHCFTTAWSTGQPTS